jgi:hypothetical protein
MLTDREIVKAEWARCYRSAEYFIQKYVFIQNPNEGGSVRFELYPFQVDLLKQFTVEKYLLILKSRQLGITTLIAAYALWGDPLQETPPLTFEPVPSVNAILKTFTEAELHVKIGD